MKNSFLEAQSQNQLPQFTLQTPQTPGTNISINAQQKELNVLTLCRIGNFFKNFILITTEPLQQFLFIFHRTRDCTGYTFEISRCF